MYSRKFNGIGILPPDYSGIALRQEKAPLPEESSAFGKDNGSKEDMHPRRPVFSTDISKEDITYSDANSLRDVSFSTEFSPQDAPKKSEIKKTIKSPRENTPKKSQTEHGKTSHSSPKIQKTDSIPKSSDHHREKAVRKSTECMDGDEFTPESFSKRSFSAEDIMLAGLLLLLMSDENSDSGLILILGILLLSGL